MAQVKEEYIDNDGIIGLWEITETVEALEAVLQLTSVEQELYSGFRNDTRRLHWLSYRLLIRRMLGNHSVDVRYADSGKPFILQPHGLISVSHSGKYSAAFYSRSRSVGIDVERIQEKISRVEHKFMAAEESDFIDRSDPLPQLVSIWAAKESLYKLCGISGLDFKEQMRISSFKMANTGIMEATVNTGTQPRKFQLTFEKVGEYMLVYVID